MLQEIKNTISEFNPGTGQLRAFGIVVGLVCTGFFMLHTDSALLLILAILFVVTAAIYPKAYLPITKWLIVLAYPIGWTLSRVLLASFFFLILAPIGIIHRLVMSVLRPRTKKAESRWCEIEKNEFYDRMSL